VTRTAEESKLRTEHPEREEEPMRRALPVLWLALVLAAACGGSETPEDRSPQAPATEPPAEVVSRAEVNSCLGDAGFAPEDTGSRIISSGGKNVEAIGVHLEDGSRVLVWVDATIDDAEGTKEYEEDILEESAYTEIKLVGNVTLVYESEPSATERDQIEGCAAGTA
jgi:hypothetical protein